jgi:hypothetical protein
VKVRVGAWLRRKSAPEPIATIREGALIFALRGDKHWGDSITWAERESDTENERRVMGWTSPRPQVGDVCAVAMESGQWGEWVFTEVDYCRDPSDMFYATIVGAFGYLADEDVPALASPKGRVFR